MALGSLLRSPYLVCGGLLQPLRLLWRRGHASACGQHPAERRFGAFRPLQRRGAAGAEKSAHCLNGKSYVFVWHARCVIAAGRERRTWGLSICVWCAKLVVSRKRRLHALARQLAFLYFKSELHCGSRARPVFCPHSKTHTHSSQQRSAAGLGRAGSPGFPHTYYIGRCLVSTERGKNNSRSEGQTISAQAHGSILAG